MPITNPILPPKAGYVEVVDSDGNHVYKATSETTRRLAEQAKFEQNNTDIWTTLKALLDSEELEAFLQAAEQFRKAMQIFASSFTNEQAFEVATVYPKWEPNVTYTANVFLTYGINSTGDPQLYKVISEHTSQADWLPDATPALYEPIGLNESGYPIWSQPSGAHDAYNTGDIVDYNGTLYQSTIDGNTWSPEAYPAGWTVYTPET